MGQPAVERLVDEESRRVDFDFRDDVATADLLRFRYREQHQRTKRAWGWGIPAGPFILLTIVQVSRPAGPAVTRAMELGMLGATALVAVLLLIPYNLWVWRVYHSQERKNMRARCNAYVKIVKLARKEGAPLPPRYPHVVPSRVSATYRRLPDDAHLSGPAK